jgi:hypothetical protein
MCIAKFEILTAVNDQAMAGARIFQKSRGYFKILGTRRAT